MTQLNITRNFMQHCSKWSRTWIIIFAHKRHPISSLTDELWGVCCEDFVENWPCYNGITFYYGICKTDVSEIPQFAMEPLLHTDGLVQGCSISSVLSLEILQSYTKPLILPKKYVHSSCIAVFCHDLPVTHFNLILQDYAANIGAIIQYHWVQWTNPEGYE